MQPRVIALTRGCSRLWFPGSFVTLQNGQSLCVHIELPFRFSRIGFFRPFSIARQNARNIPAGELLPFQ